MATLDDMEMEHADDAAVREWEALTPYVPPIPTTVPPAATHHVKGRVMGTIACPDATKLQLLALKDGKCPTCGSPSSAYYFDNVQLYYCNKVRHHRFKEARI